MTAEVAIVNSNAVAIVNSNAVAIAADSAVTIGRGKKIYNSAIKVFSLSKIAPVAIMVYGNAGLLTVPWETIIKIYRSELKVTTFSKPEDYAAHFIDFLPKQKRFFTEELQAAWIDGNIKGYLSLIRGELIEAVEHWINEHTQIDEQTTLSLLADVIERHHKRLAKLPYVENMSAEWEASFKRQYKSKITDIVGDVFQNIAVDKSSVVKLHSIAGYVHAREIMSDSHSGVVICGFGNDDVYPAVVTHLIDGVVTDQLKYKYSKEQSYRIKNGADCSIIPFAQDDMVASFMEGMNPSVHLFTEKYLHQLFRRLPDLFADEELAGDAPAKRAVRKRLVKDASKLLDEFFEQLRVHKREEHVDPILSMVRVLPKDELAAMAEALVNLTAFKRRMTDEL